jgi:hypothetical protein
MGTPDPTAFESNLELVASLLERYGHGGQARFVGGIINASSEGDIDRFVAELQSGEFWGGSGSVVDLIGLAAPPRNDETEGDSITLTRAIVHIADEMEVQGIDSKGSRFIGALYKKGLRRRGFEP